MTLWTPGCHLVMLQKLLRFRGCGWEIRRFSANEICQSRSRSQKTGADRVDLADLAAGAASNHPAVCTCLYMLNSKQTHLFVDTVDTLCYCIPIDIIVDNVDAMQAVLMELGVNSDGIEERTRIHKLERFSTFSTTSFAWRALRFREVRRKVHVNVTSTVCPTTDIFVDAKNVSKCDVQVRVSVPHRLRTAGNQGQSWLIQRFLGRLAIYNAITMNNACFRCVLRACATARTYSFRHSKDKQV